MLNPGPNFAELEDCEKPKAHSKARVAMRRKQRMIRFSLDNATNCKALFIPSANVIQELCASPPALSEVEESSVVNCFAIQPGAVQDVYNRNSKNPDRGLVMTPSNGSNGGG